MISLDPQQQAARDWFELLRDRICAAFEAIEAEAGSDARFAYTPWTARPKVQAGEGGGGVRGVMTGRFRKGRGQCLDRRGRVRARFAQSINGAESDPRFFATGISLVAHMANPHVPAVHMNTRFLTTTKRRPGGGADLNPPIPYAEDTDAFMRMAARRLRALVPMPMPAIRNGRRIISISRIAASIAASGGYSTTISNAPTMASTARIHPRRG